MSEPLLDAVVAAAAKIITALRPLTQHGRIDALAVASKAVIEPDLNARLLGRPHSEASSNGPTHAPPATRSDGQRQVRDGWDPDASELPDAGQADEAAGLDVERLRAFEDWARRWIAAADERAGMRVVVGETPPWHTVTTARALNDELRRLASPARDDTSGGAT